MKHTNTYVNNLIWKLKQEDIIFSYDTTMVIRNGVSRRLNNVVFSRGDRVYKLYEGVFFREFGQSMIFKQEKKEIKLVSYTDDIFYDDLRLNILEYFSNK